MEPTSTSRKRGAAVGTGVTTSGDRPSRTRSCQIGLRSTGNATTGLGGSEKHAVVMPKADSYRDILHEQQAKKRILKSHEIELEGLDAQIRGAERSKK
jgi:hypothetical protein